jgi:hypothetical protein
MNLQERAEKILDSLDIGCGCCSNQTTDQMKEIIVAALNDEADAAHKRGVEDVIRIMSKEWSAGSSVCLTKNHKAACHYETVSYLVSRIRARGGEAKP